MSSRLPRTRSLATIVCALVALHFLAAAVRLRLGDPAERWTSLFNLDGEANVPTWFASVLLLGSACASLARGRSEAAPNIRRGFRRLAVLFLLMSCDEVAMGHERVAAALLAACQARGIAPGAVWLLGGIFTLALGASFLGFLRALPRRTAAALLGAGTVFIGGAIGVEALGQAYARTHGYWNWTYVSFTAVEEACEFAGTLWFLHLVRT